MSKPRVSDWLVERLAAGELDHERAEALRSRLTADGAKVRLLEIAASNAAILAEHDPGQVAAEIRRRLAASEKRQGAGRGLLVPAFSVVMTCVAVLAVLVLRPRVEVPGDDARVAAPSMSGPETVRLKGLRPRLVVYLKTAAGASRREAGTFAKAGDVLQVAYVAAGRRFGVVASVDALGTVTLHLPEQPGYAQALVAQGEIPLPHAFELDDAPGFERFVFVTSDQPFHTDRVLESLRAGGTPLDGALSITDWVVRKASR